MRKDAITDVEANSAASSDGTSGRIHMRVTDALENVGIGALPYLDVDLPTGSQFDVSNLSFRIDGREVEATRVGGDPAAPIRVRFGGPWKPAEKRTVVVEYDLGAKPDSSGEVGASAEGFYIVNPGAFPAWQPPLALFVSSDLRARQESLEFALPAGFRALAPGRDQRNARSDSGKYQFQVLDTDFPTFVIAGKYQENVVATQTRRVIFWTFQPLGPGVAQAAAERLASTVAEYGRLFGPEKGGRHPAMSPIYVAEASTMLPPANAVVDGNAAATPPIFSALSFPDGALLDRRALALGIASEPVLELAEYELAQTWFGWRIDVRPEAEPLLHDGIAQFAVLEAAGAREGESARREIIARLIAAFDRNRANIPTDTVPGTKGDAPIVPKLAGTPAGRAANANKSALFLVALSDLVGKQNFDKAVHRLAQDLADQFVSDADLRSALETVSGRNLDAMFRQWLSPSDLPPDFRAHYGPQH